MNLKTAKPKFAKVLKKQVCVHLPHNLSVEVSTLKVQVGGSAESQTVPESQDSDRDREQTRNHKCNVGQSVTTCKAHFDV